MRRLKLLPSRSPVEGLLTSSRPTTVARRVVPVNTDSIDSEVFGVSAGKSPISKRNVFRPSFADTDSSTPIVGPRFVIGVSAALMHRSPNVPQAGSRFSVLGESFYNTCSLMTTARGCVSLAQVGIDDRLHNLSTGTPAINEPPVSKVSANRANDRQFSPLFSDFRCDRRVSPHPLKASTRPSKFNPERKVA